MNRLTENMTKIIYQIFFFFYHIKLNPHHDGVLYTLFKLSLVLKRMFSGKINLYHYERWGGGHICPKAKNAINIK